MGVKKRGVLPAFTIKVVVIWDYGWIIECNEPLGFERDIFVMNRDIVRNPEQRGL